MRDLSQNECHIISGGNATRENDGGAGILMFGTIVGLTSGMIGGVYGYSQHGILAGMGGAVGGAIIGAIGVPAVVIGTAILVGSIYQSVGLIDIDKM